MSNADEFEGRSGAPRETKERSSQRSRERDSLPQARRERHGPPWLLLTVLVLWLVGTTGCAALINAPVVYGGTRSLLKTPFPVDTATLDLGAGKREANTRALFLVNTAWLIDFPLTVVGDTVLLPVALVFGKEEEEERWTSKDGEKSSWWDFWH